MKAGVIAALFCCGLSTAAAASSYSEFNAGIAAFKRRDFDNARAHMNAALAAPDLNPAFQAPAHVIRGETYIIAKQPEQAIADFSQAIAADPLYLQAYQQRAITYVQMKRFDLAIADITAFIKAKPFFTAAYDERAAVYAMQKNFDAAIADLTTAIGLAPKSASAYLLRGEVYRQRGDYPKALDDFGEALDIAPNSALVYLQRGLTYERMADYARARDSYSDGARLAPSDPNMTMHLALLSWKTGDFPAAVKTFQTLRDSAAKTFPAYAALWTAISMADGGGADADVAKAAAVNFDRTKWPGPLLDLYAGTSTVQAAMKAAANGDAQAQANQLCEVNFYGGKWNLLHGNAAAGKTELETAAANCSDDFIERDAAAVALRRLQ